MTTVAIVNPHAAAGRAGLGLDALATALRPLDDAVAVRPSTAPGHATQLARQAIAEGATRLVAIGGDGTVNEVVNGFFDGEVAIGAATSLGVLPLGTGGDFARAFGLPPQLEAGIARLAGGTARAIDAGRVREAGGGIRYFANIASCGLSADVAVRVDASRWLKRHAGPAAFAWGALGAIAATHPVPVRVEIDGIDRGTFALALCAVCNGRYFGGGMHVAPMARVDDGALDVVVVEGRSRLGLLGALRDVFAGAHLTRPFVHTFRGSAIRLEAVGGEQVNVEVDGETPGWRLPVTVEVVPQALRLIT